jgi:hypothetical protein
MHARVYTYFRVMSTTRTPKLQKLVGKGRGLCSAHPN